MHLREGCSVCGSTVDGNNDIDGDRNDDDDDDDGEREDGGGGMEKQKEEEEEKEAEDDNDNELEDVDNDINGHHNDNDHSGGQEMGENVDSYVHYAYVSDSPSHRATEARKMSKVSQLSLTIRQTLPVVFLLPLPHTAQQFTVVTTRKQTVATKSSFET